MNNEEGYEYCEGPLESFFNQIINPFSEQENQLIASQMYHQMQYNTTNNGGGATMNMPPYIQPPIVTMNSTTSGIPSRTYQPDPSLSSSSSSTNPGGIASEIETSPRNGSGKSKREKAPTPTSSDDQREDGGPSKQKARRVNQNIASRNYRNRKKEYVTSIETKNQQLLSENDALKKEVAFLKRVDNFDAMKPDPSLITMVVELRHIMATIEDAVRKDADDNTISYLLQLFHLVVEKRHSVFEKDIEKLVNPFAQAKLAALGYTPVLEHPAVQSVVIGASPTDGWLKRFAEESNMTKEQIGKLLLLRDDLTKIDKDLRVERAALDRSIKEFYLHKMRVISFFPTFNFPSPSNTNQNNNGNNEKQATTTNQNGTSGQDPVDVSDVIELSRKLNALKKNFATQRNLMVNTFARLGQILTPKQQAILLLRTHINTRFDLTNMELLKNVWQSVTNNESPSVLSLLSIIPPPPPPEGITMTTPTSPPLTTIPSPLPPPSPSPVPVPVPSSSHRQPSQHYPTQSSLPIGSIPSPHHYTTTTTTNPLPSMCNLTMNPTNNNNNTISIHSIASTLSSSGGPPPPSLSSSHLSILPKSESNHIHINSNTPSSSDSNKHENDQIMMTTMINPYQVLPPSLQSNPNPLLTSLHPSLHCLQQQLQQNQFRTHM